MKNESHAHLQDLLNLIQIKPVGEDRFVGRSKNIGTNAVFGGQVLGQALMAARLTVSEDRVAHSLHAYFLQPGAHQPIDYAVDRHRDGGSFSARSVVARQDGNPIFKMTTSFQKPETGLDRHDPMPAIPGPERLLEEAELFEAVRARLPEQFRDKSPVLNGLDYRPVIPFDWLDPKPREARSSIWMRASSALPDDRFIHQALLAYASDHGPLLTATLPHGLSYVRGQVRLASIDHSIWFHRDFRMDDWLLYHIDSPNVHGSRAFCRGAIYTRAGLLVATTMQEGLMRTCET